MLEELDPKKFHILNKKQQTLAIVALTVIGSVILPLTTLFYYNFAINRPSQIDRETTVELKSGEGLSEIADKLYEKGVLNSEFLFKVYVLSKGIDKNIQAGTYTIPAGTSVVNLAEILQHGTNDIAITFLEGWRVEEFARAANSKLQDIDYENFVALAQTSEGYRFPDTYYLNVDIKEQELLDRLRTTFNDKTKDILTEQALLEANLSKEQVVIFASIVEREISNEEDRPVVAGILIKRWRNDELIGADATTQYAVARAKAGCGETTARVCPGDDRAEMVEWWPKELTATDLNSDSPYNTRKFIGLPPTPITNPGLNAIEAALNPVQTDYNYYLTDKDGITRYARSLEEHNANVFTYLQ